MTSPPRRTGLLALAAVSAALVASLVAGCGGGGGADGAPATTPVSASAQVSSGTVTGFGSVFVDGAEIDDSHASIVFDNGGGSFTNTIPMLGQRVRVLHDASGAATRVAVVATVAGPVTAIDAGAATITVAAQLVTTNTDAAKGPVTAYGGGYSSFADVAVSDPVEVHGIPVYDPAAKRYTVQATRIQKLAALERVRVTGVVANLNATARTFAINGLTVSYGSATLRPSSTALANGQAVVVLGAPGSLSGTTLAASMVQQVDADDATPATVIRTGGIVAGYDAKAGTFNLDGDVVKVGSARITPATATIADGAYVQVTGTVGADGSIAATSIMVRAGFGTATLATISLIGPITSFVDAGHFVVRDVPVDATKATLAANCTGVTLANGVVVSVVATQQPGTDVVLATRLSCSPGDMPAIAVYAGTAGSVNLTTKTFVITPAAGGATPTTVQWTDQTAFAGISGPAALEGKTVIVEGYASGGAVVARVVRTVGVLGADDYRPGMSGWATYQRMRQR